MRYTSTEKYTRHVSRLNTARPESNVSALGEEESCRTTRCHRSDIQIGTSWFFDRDTIYFLLGRSRHSKPSPVEVHRSSVIPDLDVTPRSAGGCCTRRHVHGVQKGFRELKNIEACLAAAFAELRRTLSRDSRSDFMAPYRIFQAASRSCEGE